MTSTVTSTPCTARTRSARKMSAPFSTPTSTTPSGWSVAMRAPRSRTRLAISPSSRSVRGGASSLTGCRPLGPRSLGQVLAHRLAQQHRAESATERRELHQLVLQPRPRLGIALAQVRQQHLAEEHRLALRERVVHAEVTGLDATREEAGGDLGAEP